MMIPYLCPELPARQKDALHYLVKTPLVYSSVATPNCRAFKALGVHAIYAPGSYHSSVRLNQTVDIAGYPSVSSPADPILLHLVPTPCQPVLAHRKPPRLRRPGLLRTSLD